MNASIFGEWQLKAALYVASASLFLKYEHVLTHGKSESSFDSWVYSGKFYIFLVSELEQLCRGDLQLCTQVFPGVTVPGDAELWSCRCTLVVRAWPSVLKDYSAIWPPLCRPCVL